MRPDNAVPDVSLLERFLRGQLSRDEAEPIERYLEQHPEIGSTLAELVKNDTLAHSLRGVEPVAADPPELSRLMDKLSQLRPVGDEATMALAKGNGEAALAPAQGPDEIGRLGGYRVLKLLGSGGMGMVYLAEDVQLQRLVALKVMRPEVAANPTARQRFLREARSAARLKSDYVAHVYQVSEDRQVVFLAMEFLEGMSLEDWIKKGRTPALAQVLRIGRQIALGLVEAHACGLIHRDIKPGNVWLDSGHQGRAKLLDFGLARAGADDIHLTQSGAIMGTPAYMAPEQGRGEKVDPRADLFSLGVVLYRLTTGRLPFRGDNTMSLLTSLAVDTPPPPRQLNPDLPPRLATLIERLLSKGPEQRPATARMVADELAAIEREAAEVPGGTGVSPVQAGRTSGKPVPPWRRRVAVAAAGLLLLGGVAAAIVVIIRDKDGNKLAEFNVPRDGKVEIKDDGKARDEAKAPPVAPIAAPLPPLQAGEPLSPFALVQRPAKLPGVRSWSIATRQMSIPTGGVAYRPDGKRLAVGSWDNTVNIWETQTGRLMQVLLTAGGASALAWSPDGRELAVGTGLSKQATFLYDAESGRLLRTLESPVNDFLSALAWSPDGHKLRAWGEARRCCTWEVATGTLLRAPSIACRKGTFSRDGRRLAGIADDNSHRVLIWDTDTGEQVSQLSASAPLWSVAWSPDGTRLAGSGKDGLRVWDVDTHKEAFHFPNAVGDTNAPAWSPDGRSLAFSLSNQEGSLVIELARSAEPRRLDDPYSAVHAWSPDGRTIVRVNGSHFIGLYDAATRKRLRVLSEGTPIHGFAWSPDGQTLAVGEHSRTFLISADSGRSLAEWKGATWPLAWSPDGKLLAARGRDNGVLLRGSDGEVRPALVGHESEIASMAWSPDGKRLASSAAGEKRVLIWDVVQGVRDSELGPFRGAVETVKWSTDGRLVTFNVPEVGWHVWDVEKSRLVNEPNQWKLSWFDLAPDGRSALVAPNAGEVFRLRDLVSGKDGERLPHSQAVPLAPPTWSPDGRRLAVPLYGGLELWRPDLRRRLRTLQPPIGASQVAFSRDGKRVALLSGERLCLFETETGRPCGILMLGERNNDLTIAAEGHYIGDEQVDRGIIVVVQKDDGTQELMEPADFEQKYGWKNEPGKVHLLQPLPPPPSPLPGMPMGPNALVREPAELPEVNSWTIETISGRAEARAVAYRPDGKLLATGGGDGTIRLWDPATGELVRMLVGASVSVLSWSADGKVLAAGCLKDGVWLWDAEAGRLLRRFRDPERGIATLSPGGRTLAVQVGTTLELRDADTGRLVSQHKFPAKWGSQTPPAWSPDGKIVAVSVGEAVRLWDVASAKEVQALEGHERGTLKTTWSPDGKHLVTVAPLDRAFRMWDAATGKLQGRFEIACTNLRAAALSPDGKTMALGFYQGTNGLYDPKNGQLTHSFHANGLVVIDLAWSPDGKQVALAGHEGVRLHNASTGKVAHVLEKPKVNYSGNLLKRLTWSPDSRLLGLEYVDGATSHIVQVATGQNFLPPASDGWQAAAWSPDGKTFATIRDKVGVRLWNAATNRLVRTLDGTADLVLWRLAWSADGKKVAAGGTDRLGIWSAETGKLLRQAHKYPGYAHTLAWSPDGLWLATTHEGDKSAAILWKAETGELAHQWPLVGGYTTGKAAWSPDGKLLAIGLSPEFECLLIDAASGTIRRKFPAEGDYRFLALRWSADGKTFRAVTNWRLPGHTVATSADGLVLRDFDTATGKVLRRTPLWLLDGFFTASWSPDGRVLAGSNGAEVHLSDGDGWPLGVLLPDDPFAQLAVSADGHYRGSARVERAIRVVVLKRDGTQETLLPREFEQKYGFKNDPAKVRLIEK